MLFIFLENMTLIITCIFLYNKIKRLFVSKKLSNRLLYFVTYILTTTLTLAIMANPFEYMGYSIDLRSVPLFFISYRKGWKLGLLSGILPALYRFKIVSTGAGVGVGILLGIILPVVMGYLLSRKEENPKSLLSIKARTEIILKDFMFFMIVKQFLLAVTVEIPFQTWLGISISMIFFSTLTFLSIVVIINDSEQQIKSEKKLRVSEERYRKLVEILPDGVVGYQDDKIVLINTTALDLMGVDNRADVIDYKYGNKSRDDNTGKLTTSDVMNTLVEKRIESGTSHHKISIEDDKDIDIEIRGTSFESEGKTFIINIIRDITSIKKTQLLEEKIKHEQKILEEIREYDRLKTEFFANLSHEFKTPLNLLFSTIQLMQLDAKENKNIDFDKLNRKLRILKQNCSRMVKLSNNLLDITKIDSGYFELHIQNCDIVRITEEITLSVVDYMNSNNIELIFDTDVEEKIIPVDPNAMERIMLNLLSNAVKFSKGNNQISVTIYDHGNSVVISVKDQGQGIPPDKLDVIFERFRQVDKLLNRKHEGSGIGLSLVKSLVTMHGGEIFVKSNYGEGSEFIIKLPAEELETATDTEEPENFNTRYGESINIEFSDIYST